MYTYVNEFQIRMQRVRLIVSKRANNCVQLRSNIYMHNQYVYIEIMGNKHLVFMIVTIRIQAKVQRGADITRSVLSKILTKDTPWLAGHMGCLLWL